MQYYGQQFGINLVVTAVLSTYFLSIFTGFVLLFGLTDCGPH